MATQRYISTSFWSDKWIRSLDPSERYLYMYLLTNPQTNIAGVYQITLDRIAFDTGYDERVLVPIIDRFKKSGKAYFLNEEWIVLPSWPRHQKWRDKIKIRDGIISILQDIPKAIFKLLIDCNYQFDLSIVDKTIISSKQRSKISGTTSKKVFEKFKNKCAECKSNENLNIHHIKKIKDGGDNSLANLILLCENCHKKKHSPDMTSGQSPQSRYEPNYFDSDLNSDLNSDSDNEVDLFPEKSKRFKKPTIEEISKYCKTRKNKIDPEQFFNYYESKGWKVGKTPMKSWEAAVITWEKRDREKSGPGKIDYSKYNDY